MLLFPWFSIRSWWRRLFTPRQVSPIRNQPQPVHTFRPEYEILEDRVVPVAPKVSILAIDQYAHEGVVADTGTFRVYRQGGNIHDNLTQPLDHGFGE